MDINALLDVGNLVTVIVAAAVGAVLALLVKGTDKVVEKAAATETELDNIAILAVAAALAEKGLIKPTVLERIKASLAPEDKVVVPVAEDVKDA